MLRGLDFNRDVYLQVLHFQNVSGGRNRLRLSDGRHYMEHAVLGKDCLALKEKFCVIKLCPGSYTVKEIDGKIIFLIDTVENIQPYSKVIKIDPNYDLILLPINAQKRKQPDLSKGKSYIKNSVCRKEYYVLNSRFRPK